MTLRLIRKTVCWLPLVGPALAFAARFAADRASLQQWGIPRIAEATLELALFALAASLCAAATATAVPLGTELGAAEKLAVLAFCGALFALTVTALLGAVCTSARLQAQLARRARATLVASWLSWLAAASLVAFTAVAATLARTEQVGLVGVVSVGVLLASASGALSTLGRLVQTSVAAEASKHRET